MHLSAKHQSELCQLTSIPTAPACEQQVIRWVDQWARRRKGIRLRRDRFGNMLLESTQLPRRRNPLILEAHMDHPAFVVRRVEARDRLMAEFRGGVADPYFVGTRVRLWQDGTPGPTGEVSRLTYSRPGARFRRDKQATIQFKHPIEADPGQSITWALPESTVKGQRLRAPVCDNLAGVSAALHAFDQVRRPRQKASTPADVRVLLTRCEEIGFIGAMGAGRSGLLPKASRIVVLENSKSFADSPIGSGPIVRVGDRESTFDPDLTYHIGHIAQDLAQRDQTFAHQRRLMPGGTCEATAFQSLGYTCACLCLPLGNYHNMNQRTGRIDSETISLRDYAALIALLSELARRIDDPSQAPSLQSRLSQRFDQRRHLLQATSQ